MYKELTELLERRRSIRKFSDVKVEEELIEKILNVVKFAPTAGNLEDFKITVVKSREIRGALQEITFVDDAPVVFIFSALPKASSKYYGERGEKLYSIQDATIACTYAMLAVETLGLVTTWVGNFDEKEVKSIIAAEEGEVPVAILPVGYAPEGLNTKPKELKEKEINYI